MPSQLIICLPWSLGRSKRGSFCLFLKHLYKIHGDEAEVINFGFTVLELERVNFEVFLPKIQVTEPARRHPRLWMSKEGRLKWSIWDIFQDLQSKLKKRAFKMKVTLADCSFSFNVTSSKPILERRKWLKCSEMPAISITWQICISQCRLHPNPQKKGTLKSRYPPLEGDCSDGSSKGQAPCTYRFVITLSVPWFRTVQLRQFQSQEL